MTEHNVLEPDTFDFYTDDTTRAEPIVGMLVNGLFGESVTIPMNAETAEQVGELLTAHARMFRDRPRAVTPSHARMMRHPARIAK